ncbi:hypothetical protein SDC9_51299 [bioreactor metagenome]|uniref:Uncharacterized protein n=1 Tax=bioreactor metagenome TaxID=1076179 RepID=A0A644WNH7_9ZZZZ
MHGFHIHAAKKFHAQIDVKCMVHIHVKLVNAAILGKHPHITLNNIIVGRRKHFLCYIICTEFYFF